MKFLSSAFPTSTTIVLFSSIPQTYDDLLLLYGAKSLSTSGDGYGSLFVQVNYTTYNHGLRGWYPSSNSSSLANLTAYNVPESGSQSDWTTSQYPGNAGGTGNYTVQSLYIPNYKSTSFKKTAFSTAGMIPHGGYSRTRYLSCTLNTTSAITSLRIQAWNDNYVSGTYFYLYGITKAAA